MQEFLTQMTLTEQVQYEFLRSAIQSRRNHLRMQNAPGRQVVGGQRQTAPGSVP